MRKKKIFLAVILLVFPFFYSLTQPSHLAAWVDAAFMIGLFLFIIGASMLVFEKGFFNGIAFGFKQLRKSSKEGAYTAQFDDLDETGELHKEYPPHKPAASWTAPLLITGGAAVFITLAASYLLSS